MSIQFLKKLHRDLYYFDLNNTCEDKVMRSHYFSGYRGKPVLRVNWKRPGSFGVLFINRDSARNLEDDIRHEYGHTIQLKKLGIIRYFKYVGIPSLMDQGEGEYYEKPWEVTADIYGGVKRRRPTQAAVECGINYLEKYAKRRGSIGRR